MLALRYLVGRINDESMLFEVLKKKEKVYKNTHLYRIRLKIETQ
jgi:hypothetical protein